MGVFSAGLADCQSELFLPLLFPVMNRIGVFSYNHPFRESMEQLAFSIIPIFTPV